MIVIFLGNKSGVISSGVEHHITQSSSSVMDPHPVTSPLELGTWQRKAQSLFVLVDMVVCVPN